MTTHPEFSTALSRVHEAWHRLEVVYNDENVPLHIRWGIRPILEIISGVMKAMKAMTTDEPPMGH